MKISRETWLEVEPLLSGALEMEAAERAIWLSGLDASHPAAATLVRAMLATHDRAERGRELETVSRLAPPPPWSSAHSPGARIGPFELVRPLGHGGMGEVWLARQADGRVERDVALKLPAMHLLGETGRERFRRERDILARLGHPHIARLYDAGVTDAGQPWLAMEYVEGLSLVEHTRAQSLPIARRLALFRQVLAAVAHAHRHLVVHRDLKPANILIDASGQVKLLDFGIAKLVDDGEGAAAAELTRIGGRLMTLRYAAPEQLAAGSITTATDIYALGVILHELLTGHSPYAAVREGKPLTDLMLLQQEPSVPSSLPIPKPLARALSGDLDAIVLKALRRDPAGRYASVELFDDDIGACLEKRPVKARAGTLRYLAGRFIARHKLPLATAAAVVVTLAAGLVLVDQQRRVAVAERARAERHFASVRKLANSFVFDVHDELENLAGSLKARRTLVGTALQYLDSLAGESAGNPVLALELAAAYRKLAEILGDQRGAHLGDPAGARRNAERAGALLDDLEAREPENLAALREHRVVLLFLGRLMLEGGDKSGVDQTRKAAAIAEKAVGLPGADASDRRDLGATLAEYGGILAVVKDDAAGAAEQLRRATEVLEALVLADPKDTLSQSRLAYTYDRAGIAAEISDGQKNLPKAIALFERSIEATEALVRDDPTNAFHAQSLAKRYNNAARAKLKAGDIEGARAISDRALVHVGRMVALDARDAGSASIRAGALATASEVEYRGGRYEKAVEHARAAIAADARLPADLRAGLIVRENVVGAMWTLAASNCALAARSTTPPGRREALVAEASTLLEGSRAFKQELVDRGIDAREASAALEGIAADVRKCQATL